MQASDVPRAVAAALSSAAALGLTADDAIVLQDSNRIVLRLLPCDVVARVAYIAHQPGAAFEVEIAQRLAKTASPVATLEPRVAPQISVRDGFVVTLWSYYEPVPPQAVAPAEYAHALERLHAGMRQIDMTTPHFTDRVAEAQRLVASRERTPALADADRELLSNTLRSLKRAVVERGAPSSCCTASHTQATCSGRSRGCASSIWRRVAAGRLSSTSLTRPKSSARTIQALINS